MQCRRLPCRLAEWRESLRARDVAEWDAAGSVYHAGPSRGGAQPRAGEDLPGTASPRPVGGQCVDVSASILCGRRRRARAEVAADDPSSNECGPMKFFSLSLATLLALSTASARAENWPGWRGPGRNGVSHETRLPQEWSPTQNVA